MPSLMDELSQKLQKEQDFDYEQHLSDAMHSIDISPMDVSAEERKMLISVGRRYPQRMG